MTELTPLILRLVESYNLTITDRLDHEDFTEEDFTSGRYARYHIEGFDCWFDWWSNQTEDDFLNELIDANYQRGVSAGSGYIW